MAFLREDEKTNRVAQFSASIVSEGCARGIGSMWKCREQKAEHKSHDNSIHALHNWFSLRARFCIIAQVSDLRQSFERRWKILLELNHETSSPSPAPDKTLLCHSVIAHNYPFIHEIRVATSHTTRAFKIVTVSLKRSVKRTARNDIRSRVEFYSEAICKTYKIMHIIMQFASWTQNLPSSLDSNWKCY